LSQTQTQLVLRGANLVAAELNGADLRRANLQGANLSRADLSDARLPNTCLAGTILTGACVDGWRIEAANLIDIECDYVYLAAKQLLRLEQRLLRAEQALRLLLTESLLSG
jgi:uncharacterized protein YjbI with pentapeptide repeats